MNNGPSANVTGLFESLKFMHYRETVSVKNLLKIQCRSGMLYVIMRYAVRSVYAIFAQKQRFFSGSKFLCFYRDYALVEILL